MTSAEWARDSRCQVKYATLLQRLRSGWPPEAALILTIEEAARMCSAFGESHMLFDWLADHRCAVPSTILKDRLLGGEPFERALTRVAFGLKPDVWVKTGVGRGVKSRREAFGERKSLIDWTKDERCLAGEQAVRGRLAMGIPLEAALVFASNSLTGLHWAFGERHALTYWLRDSRCIVRGSLLKARLEAGEPAESAMTRAESEPIPEIKPAGSTPEDAKNRVRDLEDEFGVMRLTLWGETKTATQWARDRRSEVSQPTLYHRINTGWPAEPSILLRQSNDTRAAIRFIAVLSSGVEVGSFSSIRLATAAINAAGGVGTVVDTMGPFSTEIPRPPRPSAKYPRAPLQITAFGETKPASQWVEDQRCVVSLEVIYRRMHTRRKKWDPEAALTTPSRATFMGQSQIATAKEYEAYGERRSVREWAEDARCKVPLRLLRYRITRGLSMAEALTETWAAPEFEAFGEWKTISEWAKTPQCKVSRTTLRLRIAKGVPLAMALKR